MEISRSDLNGIFKRISLHGFRDEAPDNGRKTDEIKDEMLRPTRMEISVISMHETRHSYW